MSKLVFRLKDVPEYEMIAIRNLLDEHSISYYETHGGNWGISIAGIWVKDNEQYAPARELIDAFQKEHTSQMRAAYQEECDSGDAETFLQRFMQNPLMVILYLLLACVIGYFSLIPFFKLGQ